METLLTRICNFPQHKFLKTFPSHIKFKTQHFISNQLSKVQLARTAAAVAKATEVLLDCNRFLLQDTVVAKFDVFDIWAHVSNKSCIFTCFFGHGYKSLPGDCNSLSCLPKYGWFPPRAGSWVWPVRSVSSSYSEGLGTHLWDQRPTHTFLQVKWLMAWE